LLGAALLLDLVLWSLVLLGVERIHEPADYARRHYLSFVFPYSHGLLGVCLLATLAGLATELVLRGRAGAHGAAAVVAVAVLSHWLLDAVVHVPDLPLLGASSPKVGLGLWEHVPAAIAVEAGVTAAGFRLFMGGHRSAGCGWPDWRSW
jgi:hypothetical protein